VLVHLAETQHGVVSLAQLRTLGLSASAVRSRVAASRLHPLHRGVYAVGRPTVSRRGRWMAAALACGRGAALSHRSALELWSVVSFRGGPPSVTGSRAQHAKPGVVLHTSRTLAPDDVTALDGIPCTTIARALLDFAGSASRRELARAVEEAERRRIFDGLAVESVLSRANGRRGAGRLRTALEEWAEPPFTRSEAERIALDLIAGAGLPAPNVNTIVAGYEVDLHWPAHRLVVEIDSLAWHSTGPALERDGARDADLDEAGLRVRRFTARQLDREPAWVVAQIRRALRSTR